MPGDPSSASPDLISGIVAIADAFERAGLSYAMGGALAYGYWGLPRSTRDIDCTVFLPVDGLEPALGALERAGCTVDHERTKKEAAERGEFQAYLGDVHVDVFVPIIPFYAEAERRRVQVDFAGQKIWIWSAEVVCVFKLLFFRGKDLVDLENLLRWGPPGLDRSFVRAQISDMMGDRDERVRFWDGIDAAIQPA